eukprot:CAMPEP_0206491146 /NCGR_PEP_ID=MMETSP0324_2-20121206/44719_1 /ASSEMBLY_ACC=CAM_ASM_000836 /TAXON_ID=2866 /ORGANISM="Crypthecodinium cohnii, Strain Seligo" /LENGTH=139 /DNA_ID=CAMNT_0053972075 /DNA_START=41 /DNA_END=457 /DNA_ORIENTATION=-
MIAPKLSAAIASMTTSISTSFYGGELRACPPTPNHRSNGHSRGIVQKCLLLLALLIVTIGLCCWPGHLADLTLKPEVSNDAEPREPLARSLVDESGDLDDVSDTGLSPEYEGASMATLFLAGVLAKSTAAFFKSNQAAW